jgi:hypothetical protein
MSMAKIIPFDDIDNRKRQAYKLINEFIQIQNAPRDTKRAADMLCWTLKVDSHSTRFRV